VASTPIRTQTTNRPRWPATPVRRRDAALNAAAKADAKAGGSAQPGERAARPDKRSGAEVMPQPLGSAGTDQATQRRQARAASVSRWPGRGRRPSRPAGGQRAVDRSHGQAEATDRSITRMALTNAGARNRVPSRVAKPKKLAAS